jgi:hypothetical protein
VKQPLGTVTIYVRDREYEAYKQLCARCYRTEADQLGWAVHQLFLDPRPLEFRPRTANDHPHQIRVAHRVSEQFEQLTERYSQAASRIAEALVIEMAGRESEHREPDPDPHPQYDYAR